MKISKKIFIAIFISSCLFFGFYKYKNTISTLETDVALQERRIASLSHKLERTEDSLQKMTSALTSNLMKSIVLLEDIKNGYSFIQTNAGVMTIFCKEEPKKSNSYVGKFLIGNPNNYLAKEITISITFMSGKDSEVETKKFSITKDLYPGSWTEITIRSDELSDMDQYKQYGSPIIALAIDQIEFKGDVEKMAQVLEIMKLTKSM